MAEIYYKYDQTDTFPFSITLTPLYKTYSQKYLLVIALFLNFLAHCTEHFRSRFHIHDYYSQGKNGIALPYGLAIESTHRD